MASRRRWVPASGAKVSPDLRTCCTRSIRPREKLSARREGRDRETLLGSHHSSRPSHSPSNAR